MTNKTIQPPQEANLFLLDRTGSMNAIKENVLAMYNEYLVTLKARADLTFTLVQFDSTSTDVVHRRVPIADVSALTEETFEPRASTPLYDAIAMIIEQAKAAYQPSDKVVITVLTDGAENCSQAYDRVKVAAMIKEITAWGWQTVFLGASFDVYGDGAKLGVEAGKTMSYNAHDRRSALRASGVAGQSINDFYECGADINFSVEQKASVGDVYAPMPPAVHDPVKPEPVAQTLIDDVKI